MSEAESSRPKLFYTRDHPLAGEEEPFPDPDNYFKLARSNQNAAHIGIECLQQETQEHTTDFDQVCSALVAVVLHSAASTVIVVGSTIAEHPLLTWKSLSRKIGMPMPMTAYYQGFH